MSFTQEGSRFLTLRPQPSATTNWTNTRRTASELEKLRPINAMARGGARRPTRKAFPEVTRKVNISHPKTTVRTDGISESSDPVRIGEVTLQPSQPTPSLAALAIQSARPRPDHDLATWRPLLTHVTCLARPVDRPTEETPGCPQSPCAREGPSGAMARVEEGRTAWARRSQPPPMFDITVSEGRAT